MKMYKVLLTAAAVTALFSGCGSSSSTKKLSEETETTTYQTVSGEYTGEADISVNLPGGDWQLKMDTAEGGMLFIQGDKTIAAAIYKEDTSKLIITKEELIERFTKAGSSNIDVLDFSCEETESGTTLLRYVMKCTGSGSADVETHIASIEILAENKAVVVNGNLNTDADDADIAMMREAVDAARLLTN